MAHHLKWLYVGSLLCSIIFTNCSACVGKKAKWLKTLSPFTRIREMQQLTSTFGTEHNKHKHILTCIVLNKLQKLEWQCGLSAGRSTIGYSRFDSCKRNVENTGDHYTQPMSIWQGPKAEKGVFTLLDTNGYFPRLTEYDHPSTQRYACTLQYDGSSSKAFQIRNGMKHPCTIWRKKTRGTT